MLRTPGSTGSTAGLYYYNGSSSSIYYTIIYNSNRNYIFLSHDPSSPFRFTPLLPVSKLVFDNQITRKIAYFMQKVNFFFCSAVVSKTNPSDLHPRNVLSMFYVRTNTLKKNYEQDNQGSQNQGVLELVGRVVGGWRPYLPNQFHRSWVAAAEGIGVCFRLKAARWN